MSKAQPIEFSRQARENLLKRIIDLESLIYEKGFRLNDLHPRNVIITSQESVRPVVFIDLANSIVFDKPDSSDDSDSVDLSGHDVDDDFMNQIKALRKNMKLVRHLTGYVSPLVRWREQEPLGHAFHDWLGEEIYCNYWNNWIDTEYASTWTTIKPEMLARWPVREGRGVKLRRGLPYEEFILRFKHISL
ncbi:hypothetical protein N7495_007177 [Penicillium taxi]|uniref:uncharacterized protein n=1 Tax=Penicillium taxi TaxID=168475 RepID=UPI002545A677|nr:uncharacterized protein N7495_007177 [Penicillium taxi]KAJ5895486.1 hypothetical protein N7495_007177 [Penicillium taxi]